MRVYSSDALAGRTALVTGGGTGLGFQIAEHLGRAGAALTLCGRRADVLDAAVSALEEEGVAARAIAGDVTEPEDVHRIRAAAPPIDILVNCAGYTIRTSSWTTQTLAQMREVFRINVEAPMLMAQAFVPHMTGRRWGRVINIGSIFSAVGTNPANFPGVPPDNGSYVAAKHAVVGWTRFLAAQVAAQGVTVNTLSPGVFLRSERDRGLQPDRLSSNATLREAVGRATPMARLGDVDDLGGVAVFLASDASAYVTGQNLLVDGGYTLW